MLKNVLIDTASTRAHSAILNSLKIEVITRRDTAVTVYDRAELRIFTVAHKAFESSWNKLMPHVDSISYAVAWDAHLEGLSKAKQAKSIETANGFIGLILDDVAVDLENLLPISSIEAVSGAESALVSIVGVENQSSLLAMI